MTILALLPLPIGVILAIALMWNELNRRNKIHKSMVEYHIEIYSEDD